MNFTPRLRHTLVFALLLTASPMQGFARPAESQRAVAAERLRPAKTFSGRVISTHTFDGFAEGLTNAAGDALVYFEPSTTVFDGERLYMASDKPIPGTSSVVSFQLNRDGLIEQASRRYHTTPTLLKIEKIEGMSLEPVRNGYSPTMFVMSGFTKYKANSAKNDSFNMLLAWTYDDATHNPDILMPSERDGVVSSLPLRTLIAKALANAEFPTGMPYFKLEGLACIPGNRLLIGVREHGHDDENFEYAAKLLMVSYRYENDKVVLNNEVTLIADFEAEAETRLQRAVGVSSLEFDSYHNQLLILTSYEDVPSHDGPVGDGVTAVNQGAYLWTLPLDHINTSHAPSLVSDDQGSPLHLHRKAEGVTVLSDKRLLVIYDDDRILSGDDFARQPHQGSYSLIELSNQPTGASGPSSASHTRR